MLLPPQTNIVVRCFSASICRHPSIQRGDIQLHAPDPPKDAHARDYRQALFTNTNDHMEIMLNSSSIFSTTGDNCWNLQAEETEILKCTLTQAVRLHHNSKAQMLEKELKSMQLIQLLNPKMDRFKRSPLLSSEGNNHRSILLSNLCHLVFDCNVLYVYLMCSLHYIAIRAVLVLQQNKLPYTVWTVGINCLVTSCC